MPGTAFNQPNYPSPSQSGALYPTSLDAITQVMARIATAFNPHAVPAPPAAPVLSASAGGTLGARTYYVKITYVTLSGEIAPSVESSIALSANNLLNVASPPGSSASRAGTRTSAPPPAPRPSRTPRPSPSARPGSSRRAGSFRAQPRRRA